MKYSKEVTFMAEKTEMTFEQSIKRLEQIAQLLENGETPIEESLKLFEEGAALLRGCNKTLEDAEKKVSLLVGKTDDGEPITEPFAEMEIPQ